VLLPNIILIYRAYVETFKLIIHFVGREYFPNLLFCYFGFNTLFGLGGEALFVFVFGNAGD
jgi:hypothetical protein